jgi:chromosomal replication initiator protein
MATLSQGVSSRLRERLDQVAFETWISPLSFVGIEGHTATLQAPNKFFRNWVNDRYLNDLRQCVSAETGVNVEIALVAAQQDSKQDGVSQVQVSPPTARCQTSNLNPGGRSNLDPRYTFDQFVVGSSNQFAHAAAMAVANQPGEKYNPLFLYGGVGLGKTHLATSIGHQLSASDRARKIIFAPAELFMNDLISSLRHDRMSGFKERMRQVDVLILDDVHFLAGRERTQEEFFHTFNALHAQRHQIVLTSDKAPRDLTGLEERLRNRFESGLIADISPPDLETRVAILQKKAALENLNLEPDVALYVAQSVLSNVRELEGCLTRLAAFASLNRRAITVDFARQALRDLIREQEVELDIELIQKRVSEFFHIQLAELKSKKRTQHIAFCRQVAMYLCRKLTDSSFPTIGDHFGRDHSTVIHANNLIGRRVTNDTAFRHSMEKIERDLKNARHDGA